MTARGEINWPPMGRFPCPLSVNRLLQPDSLQTVETSLGGSCSLAHSPGRSRGLERPPRTAGVTAGRRPPGGLGLDAGEHGGRLAATGGGCSATCVSRRPSAKAISPRCEGSPIRRAVGGCGHGGTTVDDGRASPDPGVVGPRAGAAADRGDDRAAPVHGVAGAGAPRHLVARAAQPARRPMGHVRAAGALPLRLRRGTGAGQGEPAGPPTPPGPAGARQPGPRAGAGPAAPALVAAADRGMVEAGVPAHTGDVGEPRDDLPGPLRAGPGEPARRARPATGAAVRAGAPAPPRLPGRRGALPAGVDHRGGAHPRPPAGGRRPRGARALGGRPAGRRARLVGHRHPGRADHPLLPCSARCPTAGSPPRSSTCSPPWSAGYPRSCAGP